ncbi:MAG: hypothetical protein IKJ65_06195 [Clostridia bacterium]|nr:hypothetical protein [Clostridia bacterium]
MKKIVAILLMVVLSMAFTGMAEKIDFAAEKNAVDFAEKSVKAGAEDDATQTDMVQINGNQYAILTSDFVGISYVSPSNYVFVLTQDYLHQAEIFDAFYNDGLKAALNFIDQGIHLNVYDADTGLDIYVQVIESGLGEYFPDAENLSEAEIQYVHEYFRGAGFTDEETPTFKKVGGNHYFFFDLSDTDQRVYMYTMKGGKVICIQYNAVTAELVERGVELLESLTVSSLTFVQS